MNIVRTLDAESEVLSLTDVKSHLRITSAANDDAFRMFIAAIRHRTEIHLAKTLVTTTWQYTIDAFQDEIKLPMWPIQSITTVDYVDTDGNSQTLSSSIYQFDIKGRLKPSFGNAWPATRDQYDAVTITYVAGKVHPGFIEPDIKMAMLLWIGSADVARENTVIGAGVVVSQIPSGAVSLLAPHRTIGL